MKSALKLVLLVVVISSAIVVGYLVGFSHGSRMATATGVSVMVRQGLTAGRLIRENKTKDALDLLEKQNVEMGKNIAKNLSLPFFPIPTEIKFVILPSLSSTTRKMGATALLGTASLAERYSKDFPDYASFRKKAEQDAAANP
ncbi:MAG: hypothetical protein PHC88_06110 [Terrimicrobiaceae bacterium]|nr:hypothetical protein [Terrimicrobiaceae bacterium]